MILIQLTINDATKCQILSKINDVTVKIVI